MDHNEINHGEEPLLQFYTYIVGSKLLLLNTHAEMWKGQNVLIKAIFSVHMRTNEILDYTTGSS